MANQFFRQGVWNVSPDQLSNHGMAEAVEYAEAAEACCCTQSAKRLGYRV